MGEKLLITGMVGTVKSPVAVLVTPPTVTVTDPVTAPTPTVATSSTPVAEVTVAGTPPIDTSLSAKVAEKFRPVMVTDVPGGPEVGEKEIMIGQRTLGSQPPMNNTPNKATITILRYVMTCPPAQASERRKKSRPIEISITLI
jgi:hypothetical protein